MDTGDGPQKNPQPANNSALQLSELRYRRLFETAQDGILILDGETGKIVDANPFILDLLGYPLEYFIGKELWELGFIRDKTLAEKAFAELKTNRYLRYEDIPLETKDGRRIDVEFISNLYPVDHEPVIQCNIRDITDRKKAQDALAITRRKLQILSEITRHDINNQLMSLNGFLELLHRKMPDPSHTKYFTCIADATARISAMIRFAKLYEQVGSGAPAWQEGRALVETAAKEAPVGQVAVRNDLPAGMCLFADPLILKVFYNLIDNAVKYGGTITTIRFSLEERDGRHVLLCEDDGAGILAEEKERVFDRGFGKNTGLGLTISREILAITGITIRETGEPGTGARFEMTIPDASFRTAR